MKRAFGLALLSASLLSGLASCSKDTVEADPYERWAERNEAYLDSVIRVSENPPVGETWRKHLNYKIKSENLTGDIVTKRDYVYVKVLQEGKADGITPLSTDTVYTAYKGYLMNGTLFDSSIKRGQPATFGVNQVIPGWVEALQLMSEGAEWQLYIPSELAYGSQGAGPVIGPHSTLIFDVKLIKIERVSGIIL